MHRLKLLSVIVLAAMASVPPAAFASDIPTVFAAASLSDAMTALGRAFRERTGREIRFSFASSSTLARQIEAGAPAQIFASANERWMDYLAGHGLIEAKTRVSPIGNRLALIAPKDRTVQQIDITAATDLPALLGQDARLAVGDPAHVPAGIYAKQALQALGFWPALESRLARADNVRAALALVERGEAPLGIVYSTDAAISPKVEIVGLFPRDSHPPITYPFAILKDQASKDVNALFAFMTGPAAFAIYERFGFVRTD
jgi:molybdate transport system substrate-binding protein